MAMCSFLSYMILKLVAATIPTRNVCACTDRLRTARRVAGVVTEYKISIVTGLRYNCNYVTRHGLCLQIRIKFLTAAVGLTRHVCACVHNCAGGAGMIVCKIMCCVYLCGLGHNIF